MFLVISYDIVDDKKRNELAKLLENHGIRVQKSVFECQLDEKRYLKLKEQIEKKIDMKEDSVRYYYLCKKCIERIEISGWGTVSQEEDFIII